jgi:hypothetical protein
VPRPSSGRGSPSAGGDYSFEGEGGMTSAQVDQNELLVRSGTLEHDRRVLKMAGLPNGLVLDGAQSPWPRPAGRASRC